MTSKILIVEDEVDLSAIIADYVAAGGFMVEVIADGNKALDSIRREMPDLIVLDIMLPGLDGVALCERVRAFSDVPIIMVTARVQEIDRLLGLETGADDYLCKPFSPRELVARIKAVLRRQRRPDREQQLFDIEASTRTVRIRSQALDLTPAEYNLFTAMARRPGTIYSRAQLLDLVKPDSLDIGDRAIDTHVKNLRRKIAVLAPGVNIVQSVYGLGYRVDT
jgi:two-component system, OmpR family, response regulator BaeR